MKSKIFKLQAPDFSDELTVGNDYAVCHFKVPTLSAYAIYRYFLNAPEKVGLAVAGSNLVKYSYWSILFKGLLENRTMDNW